MSPQFHEYNVIEYYNHLLHAIDSTYDAKAFGKEAKTMQFIRLWLSEIERLGHKDSFVTYLGNRKSLLALRNPLYVHIMESLRMLMLNFIKK